MEVSSVDIDKNLFLLFKDEIEESQKAGKEFVTFSYNEKASNNWRCADWDSFMNFMQGGSVETYWRIAKKCKEHGITHVYDIGCNCGWQAKIFRFMGIKYTGVEAEKASLDIAPTGERIDYIARPYPFEIHVDDKEHTAAVSNLCLGYLFPDNQKETYDRLAEDFKYFCGSLGPDEMNYFASLYGMSEAEKGFIFWGDRNRVNEREGYEEVRKEQDALFNGTMIQRKTADLAPDFKQSDKVKKL